MLKEQGMLLSTNHHRCTFWSYQFKYQNIMFCLVYPNSFCWQETMGLLWVVSWFPFSFRSYDIQSLLVTIWRDSQSCIFRIANIFSRSARKLISFKDEKSVRFRKSQNQRDLLFPSYLPLNDIRYFNLS